MHYAQTSLPGAWLIQPESMRDERGMFARTFCARDFALHGLHDRFVQTSMSQSARAGTLRGLHFQIEPHAEVKLVSCIKGAIMDVVVDMRPYSATRLKWTSATLTAENRAQLYVPRGFAHGFMTLTDDTIVHYQISDYYEPAASSGLRYDDPVLGIRWPATPTVISERDRAWPYLKAVAAAG